MGAFNFCEAVDDVARNKNVIWMLLFGVFDDCAELLIVNGATKVDITENEDIVGIFCELVIKTIARFVESLHAY